MAETTHDSKVEMEPPRGREARRTVATGSGVMIFAVALGFIGIFLTTMGQLPALILLPVALAVGVWGKSHMKKMQQNQP